jgi:ribosomal protein S18 acetylase RimI-like enzyme
VTVIDDALARRDIRQLARMHVEALPDSLVSQVGERYARAFYRYAVASPHEVILTARAGGSLSGACMMSLAPDTLSRRLLVRTPLALFAPFAIRRLPLRALLLGSAASEVQPPGPEILLIFTVPEVRSRGLGAQLLARCEALLVARGVDRLLVKTRDDPANRALAFYERARFHRIASRTVHGKRLAVLEKTLP